MGFEREFDIMIVPTKGEINTPPPPRKNLSLSVVEPDGKDIKTSSQELDRILIQYIETLSHRTEYHIGYPVNICYEHHAALAPLLQFHLNNCGDPFTQNTVDFHSKDFEVAVLDWFAQLWEIEKDEYWGYITNGGTEGNLHGLLIGRELHPTGIIYASKDSHYSIFKAARMYRMEIETINTLVNGEIDYADLRSKLLLNKNKPAIINIILVKTITFKKPIGSVSISGHKFLGCPMPCGIQITRKSYITSLSTKIEYIASVDATISGSRNGLAPIFLWYSLCMKGRAGLQQDAKMCNENARYLKGQLHKAGISTMLNESSIIVVFERPNVPKFIRHWQLSCTRDMAHVVVMPGITRETIDNFFKDLMQERKKWYQVGIIVPPCLADDIGSQNCLCSKQKMRH
nr:histidine decarboxylase-like isoform X1 [Nicotiana tomentosiformis]